MYNMSTVPGIRYGAKFRGVGSNFKDDDTILYFPKAAFARLARKCAQKSGKNIRLSKEFLFTLQAIVEADIKDKFLQMETIALGNKRTTIMDRDARIF